MGNISTLNNNSLNSPTNIFANIANNHSIGPSNVLFQKMSPKIFDLNEDMLTAE